MGPLGRLRRKSSRVQQHLGVEVLAAPGAPSAGCRIRRLHGSRWACVGRYACVSGQAGSWPTEMDKPTRNTQGLVSKEIEKADEGAD